MTTTALDAAASLARARRHTTMALFVMGALGAIGLITSLTVAPIVADKVMGFKALSGMPSSASLVGTALGSTLLSRLAARWGRRATLVGGFVLAAAGAAMAVSAIRLEHFAFFTLAMFVLGTGHAAAAQVRFAAADVQADEHRTAVLSRVVWAGTIGAIAGPALIGPSASAAIAAALPELSGPPAASIVAYVLAAAVGVFALQHHAGLVIATADEAEATTEKATAPDFAPTSGQTRWWRIPDLRLGVVTLVVGHFIMVFLMTMTPIRIIEGGHGLGAVSAVMSAHILGMYALTPVAGWLAGRYGERKVIALGLTLLLASGILAAAAPATSVVAVGIALWLLGFGWSFGFVAGSGLLTRGGTFAERVRVQGLADTLVFTAAATASAGSGVVIAVAGFPALAIAGGLMVAVPAAVLWQTRLPHAQARS